MSFHTITFKGATDSAFTTGVVTKTLSVLAVSPHRVKVGEDAVYIGYVVRATRHRRTVVEIEFAPFLHSGSSGQTTQDLYELDTLLAMPYVRIESCTLPRWSNATDFPTIVGMLPMSVELGDTNIAINKEAACTEASYVLNRKTLD